MLKFTEEKIMVVDYGDFDTFISERFGVEYECVADNEWNNYSSYDFSVQERDVSGPTDDYFHKYTVRDVEEWISTNKKSIGAGDLLEYLAWKKEIPFGKYLIKVFW
jgi:hypothetical protein